jgi:steroid delta-isomerase-like uncharacterized protein
MDVTTLPERLFDHISRGDLDAVDALLAPGYTGHGAGGQTLDSAGLRGMLDAFRTGFPDMQVRALDVLVDGDRVAWRVDGEGTHTGEFLGMPATGQRVRFGGVDLAVVRDGRITEHWSGEDLAGVLMQIGALPAPAPA